MRAAFPKRRVGRAWRAAANDANFFADGGFAPAFGEGGLGGFHEPGFEQALGQRLQRLVHPPVQLNLVVQRAQHRSDGALLGERRQNQIDFTKLALLDA